VRQTPAGQRRKLISIEYPVDDASDPGNPTWKLHSRNHAKITPLGGIETFAFCNELVPIQRHTIRILYRSGILPTMRATLGNRKFNFLAVANVEELNIELEITAIERL